MFHVCTSSRSAVGHRDVPGFMTKWNNFLPIGNSTFAPTEFRDFFPKWKAAPFSTRLAAMLQTKLQAIVVRFNLKVTVERIPVKSQ